MDSVDDAKNFHLCWCIAKSILHKSIKVQAEVCNHVNSAAWADVERKTLAVLIALHDASTALNKAEAMTVK
jgi:hypothetical protein